MARYHPPIFPEENMVFKSKVAPDKKESVYNVSTETFVAEFENGKFETGAPVENLAQKSACCLANRCSASPFGFGCCGGNRFAS